MHFKKAAILLVLTFAAGVPAAIAQPSAPRASVSAKTFDFGTVREGTTVTHEFQITNTGSAPLVLERTVAACGCTVSTVSPTTVAPEGTAEVKVEFRTQGFTGREEKSVRVYTNDPAQQVLALTIQGVVEGEAEINPQRVVFEHVTPDQEVHPEAAVHVRLHPQSASRITRVHSASPFLKVETSGVAEKEVTVRVILEKLPPAGELRDRVLVDLEGGDRKNINIPVLVKVDYPLRLKPPIVSFGLLGPGTLEREVLIENRGRTPLTLEEPSADHEGVTAELEELTKGKSYRLLVKVDPEKVKKLLRTAVAIRTNLETQERLLIPVLGVKPGRE